MKRAFLPYARVLLGAVALPFALSFTSVAAADEAPDAKAERLFNEGKTLLEHGEVATACDKLRESQELDAAGGTALLLGICYETEAKLASAWSMLRAARAIAVRQNRADRIEVADAHIRQIEPQLSYLNVHVVPGDGASGLRVFLDEATLDPSAWNQPIPVDSGRHALRTEGGRRAPSVRQIEVGAKPGTTDVQVDVLEPGGAAHRSRIPALVVGAVAVVAVGATAYFGIDAISSEGQKPASCVETDSACASRWHSLEDRRGTDATVATITGGVAIAAAVTAIVLLIIPPAGSAPKAGWRLVPSRVGSGGGELVVRF